MPRREVKFQFLFCIFAALSVLLAAVYLYHTVTFDVVAVHRHNNSGYLLDALQYILVATANGAFSVCVRVYACAHAILNTSWAIPTHLSSEFQKLPCNTAGATVQQ